MCKQEETCKKNKKKVGTRNHHGRRDKVEEEEIDEDHDAEMISWCLDDSIVLSSLKDGEFHRRRKGDVNYISLSRFQHDPTIIMRMQILLKEPPKRASQRFFFQEAKKKREKSK
jgi:hypothetical protein